MDSEPLILSVLREVLSNAGAQVHTAVEGQEALRLFQSVRPDLVLLDDMIPNMGGWRIGPCIREHSRVPIIFLPAAGPPPPGIMQELGAGVVDYLPKPFDPGVLVARCQAALRQVQSARRAAHQDAYSDEHLTIDLRARSVLVEGEPADLTPTEYRLLAYLTERAGQVVTFDQLLKEVWGPGYEGSRDSIHLYIWQLRQKLERDPKRPEYLVSERGVGYRFQGRASDLNW